MIRAITLKRIFFKILTDQNMSGFGVDQTMNRFSVNNNPSTYSGSDCVINEVADVFRTAPFVFGECCAVYIGIKPDR